MHNIELKVNDNAYAHLMYFLSNIKDDIEILSDELTSKISTSNDEFQIDEAHCLRTLKKIKSGDLSSFKPIENIDDYINELTNNIS